MKDDNGGGKRHAECIRCARRVYCLIHQKGCRPRRVYTALLLPRAPSMLLKPAKGLLALATDTRGAISAVCACATPLAWHEGQLADASAAAFDMEETPCLCLCFGLRGQMIYSFPLRRTMSHAEQMRCREARTFMRSKRRAERKNAQPASAGKGKRRGHQRDAVQEALGEKGRERG